MWVLASTLQALTVPDGMPNFSAKCLLDNPSLVGVVCSTGGSSVTAVTAVTGKDSMASKVPSTLEARLAFLGSQSPVLEERSPRP